MKKLIIVVFGAFFLMSCSKGLFGGKEKLGCKTNGRNVGAEKIAAGDPKATKASKKAKYKGGKAWTY